MKMTDMKRSKKERKEESEGMGHKIGEDDYPYGLSIRLDHHGLKKLGLHEGAMPKVGSKLTLHAHAHVKSAGESHHEGGKPNRHLELELRHMNIEGGAQNGSKKLMGKDGDSEEMHKGMKDSIDTAVNSPKDGGSESADGEEA